MNILYEIYIYKEKNQATINVMGGNVTGSWNKLLVGIPISNLLHCFLVDFHNSIYISLHQVDFSQLYEGGVMTVVLNRMFQTVFGLDTDAEISI